MSEIEKDWVTEAGLRAVVLIVCFGNRKHHRCGYVGVPQGHILYGVDYSQPIDEIKQSDVDHQPFGKKGAILTLTATVNGDGEDNIRRSPDILFDVHGGLTFSDRSDKYPAPSDLWWFGFDCAHYGDGVIEPSEYDFSDGPVRELSYVETECESLASQIVERFPIKEPA